MFKPHFTRPENPVSLRGKRELVSLLRECEIDYKNTWAVYDKEGIEIVSAHDRLDDLWEEVRTRDTLLSVEQIGGPTGGLRLVRNIRTITSRVTHEEVVDGLGK